VTNETSSLWQEFLVDYGTHDITTPLATNDFGCVTWTFTVDQVESQMIDASLDSNVEQGIGSFGGLVSVDASGINTTTIVVESSIGVVFDASTSLVIGTTTIEPENIIGVAHTTRQPPPSRIQFSCSSSRTETSKKYFVPNMTRLKRDTEHLDETTSARPMANADVT